MNSLDAAFAHAEPTLESFRAVRRARLAAESEDELARLLRSRADDAATYPSRTEYHDLDELEEELRASARAAVFVNGTWAVRMAEAADAIASFRGRLLT